MFPVVLGIREFCGSSRSVVLPLNLCVSIAKSKTASRSSFPIFQLPFASICIGVAWFAT